jgi:hypothetical protein
MIHKYKNGWIYAEEEEHKAHDDNGTWTDAVTIPAGIFDLPTKWVYKYKFNKAGKLTKLKARLVVCGNRQNTDFWRETYAAVARSPTLKVSLALVTALDLECNQADVITAFLTHALYGLRRSPRIWYQELARHLATIVYHPIEADPCVLINATGSIILAYVDDLVMITRTKAEIAALKAELFSKFKRHDLGPIAY